MPKTLRIFIGSSREGLDRAKEVQDLLYEEDDAAGKSGIVVKGWWSKGTFRISETFIQSLERVMRETDAAILIATSDDVTVSRGQINATLRDNIAFEAGMSIAAHGPELTALALIGAPKLPGDLDGLTHLPLEEGNSPDEFRERNRGSVRALLHQWKTTLERRGKEQQETAVDYEDSLEGTDSLPSPHDWEASATDSEIGRRLVKTIENYDASLLSRTNLIWSYPVNWIAVPELCKQMNLGLSAGNQSATPHLVTVGKYRAFQEQYKWRQLGYNVQRTFESESGIQAVSGVTERQLADLIKNAGSDPLKNQSDLDEPVRSISWFDAVAYCLSIRGRLPTLDEAGDHRAGDRRIDVWEWTQSWFDRSSAHLAVNRVDTRPIGVNPDLRLNSLGFRVIHFPVTQSRR